jgi:hypothetical protein
LEELLQEEIADEFDRREWKEERLSQLAVKKWKQFVQRRKKERESPTNHHQSLPDVVEKAMDAQKDDAAGESTGLLGGKKKKIFFGVF